ncbi:MAG: aminotransferase class V-fold PLP-dependent enzyme [Phycisphaerales bacterium]|nr:MAG: aminotransferase class V-fold PLP-dependent enzyme [Phycisphaerales bacterium]
MPPMSTRRIYLDNAATSFPKPPGVLEAMTRFATELGASPGRGAYAESREADELLWRCRERINTLINGAGPERVIFTLNCTDALNLAIKGIVQPGPTIDHVVTTWMAHNSVLRPLNALVSNSDADQTRVVVDPATGWVDPDEIRRAIRPNTRLVAINHASNVTGSRQPIEAIGRICRERNVPLLVDAAQTLGHIPIDVRALHIDLLAFPGHKGLLGPLGTGGLYIAPGMEKRIRTIREGGTGSRSERDTQPNELPDKYEPGSHNAIGLAGLSEGVAYLLERTVEDVEAHETRLMVAFLDALREGDGQPPNLRLLGPQTHERRTAVFSVVIEGVPPQTLAKTLEDRHGLLTRAGLHCAPLAHRAMGTAPNNRPGASTLDVAGATRLSFGCFLTEDDAKLAAHALREAAQDHAAKSTASATG